ncbi:MAG: hypothetical protein KBF88_00380 [Polyangiaceae bacterium]|nr:hypothetical protein [Polyangiaceae bacterium]
MISARDTISEARTKRFIDADSLPAVEIDTAETDASRFFVLGERLFFALRFAGTDLLPGVTYLVV